MMHQADDLLPWVVLCLIAESRSVDQIILKVSPQFFAEDRSKGRQLIARSKFISLLQNPSLGIPRAEVSHLSDNKLHVQDPSDPVRIATTSQIVMISNLTRPVDDPESLEGLDYDEEEPLVSYRDFQNILEVRTLVNAYFHVTVESAA